MLPVLDNQTMREADRSTIEDLGVPGIILMENAATGVVDAFREHFPEARRVLILCGPGNNGGDGLAVARHLANGGQDVRVLLFADPERLGPDARLNYDLAVAFSVAMETVSGDDISVFERELTDCRPDVVIDALLGTGLDRPLTGRLESVVCEIESSGLPVVAVDVPTGLSGATAAVPGATLAADLTVTFAALKICHVLPPACFRCGEIAIVDIGIPPISLESNCALWWPEEEDIRLLLPHRSPDSHKGSHGHLLVVAGGEGRGGAVAMAGRSAVIAGSGLVTMAVPQPVVAVADAGCLEAMTYSLPANEIGEMAGPQGLESILERMTAIAVGPGMGTGAGAAATLDWLLDTWQGPMLLDADAVNLLAAQPHRLAGREQPAIITPHPGELARFIGWTTEDVVADRLAAAREASSKSKSVVVAKGHRTVIAEPGGTSWINPTGGPSLATGGSGDVLTGAIAAFLAQGLDPVRAAIAGCWLHGRAGEIGTDVYPAAVPAAELPDLLAHAWKELESP